MPRPTSFLETLMRDTSYGGDRTLHEITCGLRAPIDILSSATGSIAGRSGLVGVAAAFVPARRHNDTPGAGVYAARSARGVDRSAGRLTPGLMP